jgi:hypothetical protein
MLKRAQKFESAAPVLTAAYAHLSIYSARVAKQ